jgi:hypothetical protein
MTMGVEQCRYQFPNSREKTKLGIEVRSMKKRGSLGLVKLATDKGKRGSLARLITKKGVIFSYVVAAFH